MTNVNQFTNMLNEKYCLQPNDISTRTSIKYEMLMFLNYILLPNEFDGEVIDKTILEDMYNGKISLVIKHTDGKEYSLEDYIKVKNRFPA